MSDPMIPGGQVALQVEYLPDAIPTAEDLAALLDGIQAYHDAIVEASGLEPQPIWVERISHPNSLIVIASAFLLAHKGTFLAGVASVGTFALAALGLRKAQLELRKIKLEVSLKEKELASKEKEETAAHRKTPQVDPHASLKQAIKEAIAVLEQLSEQTKDLTDEQRARIFQATLLAKLAPAEREEVGRSLAALGLKSLAATDYGSAHVAKRGRRARRRTAKQRLPKSARPRREGVIN